MLTFVARRIAYSIPVLLVASILVFGFVHATTDPTARLRTSRDAQLIVREKHRLGLDKPLVNQYLDFANKFVHGDMGESYVTHRAVSHEISGRLWNTIQLIFWGVLISGI